MVTETLKPSQKLILSTIAKHEPFERVLEVGCGDGDNLYCLVKQYPKVSFGGFDLDLSKVICAEERLKNFENVAVFWGDARYKASFLSRYKYDIVFSSAVLMYIHPKDIETVIGNMKSVAKKAIILIEHHGFVEKDKLIRSRFLKRKKYWIRDYTKLFNVTEITKIPESVWGDNWARWGYILESKCSDTNIPQS